LDNILKKIDAIFCLPLREKEILLSRLEKVELPKCHLLMSTDKVERYVYFIEKGVARAYCNTEKKEVTICFGEEGDVMLSFLSFFNGQPGYECIELLEDSTLYRISSQILQKLYAEHIILANWGRKLAEQELLKTEERFMSLQFKNATQRYRELLEKQPSLIQRVPLGQIASYLGVTQVTLSRIRSEIK
jgi:CRP-like cAMP-binding protein